MTPFLPENKEKEIRRYLEHHWNERNSKASYIVNATEEEIIAVRRMIRREEIGDWILKSWWIFPISGLLLYVFGVFCWIVSIIMDIFKYKGSDKLPY